MGSKSDLLRTLVAASSGQSAAFGVHNSVLKWRTRQDSNLRPLESELVIQGSKSLFYMMRAQNWTRTVLPCAPRWIRN